MQDLSTELKLKMRVPRWTPQPGAAPGLATRWQAYLAALTASLALVAILWQGLPAFIA